MNASHAITDPTATPETASLGLLERFFLKRLRDPRDMPFVRRIAFMSVVMPAAATLMFLLPPMWVGLLALPYLALMASQLLGRYLLLQHAAMHRQVFKKKYEAWNHWIPWVGPLFGVSPTSFYVHHMGMHHPENNMEADESSTLCYTRDNVLHWLHYWARFMFFGYVHLSRYLWQRGRTKLLVKFWIGETSWFLLVGLAFYLNWAAALVCIVFPLVLTRTLMMMGNFAQHAFVDVSDPNNGFKNSTCLTNTRYNHKCYNDGYHIVHHVKPSLHWTEMPLWYQRNLQRFVDSDALVFSGVPDNQAVWFHLMRHDYGWLADRVVQLQSPPRSREETIAWLQQLTRTREGRIKHLWEFHRG